VTPALADKVITRRAVNRFKITARLARGRRQAGQRDRSLAERTKGQDYVETGHAKGKVVLAMS
jgi:hypothetical protein